MEEENGGADITSQKEEMGRVKEEVRNHEDIEAAK
jgi:hypothetical protein